MKAARKFLIAMLIGALGVFAILWGKDLFAQTQPVKIFHILSDAFFAVGTVLFCGGLLVFSSNEGTFDMLVYGLRSFADMFRRESKKKYDTFFDYRESRADKKLRFGFLLLAGAIYLLVAFVMYCLYRQYSL